MLSKWVNTNRRSSLYIWIFLFHDVAYHKFISLDVYKGDIDSIVSHWNPSADSVSPALNNSKSGNPCTHNSLGNNKARKFNSPGTCPVTRKYSVTAYMHALPLRVAPMPAARYYLNGGLPTCLILIIHQEYMVIVYWCAFCKPNMVSVSILVEYTLSEIESESLKNWWDIKKTTKGCLVIILTAHSSV